MDLSDENWKRIKGYEDLYQVSNLGNVRSLNHYAMRGRGIGLYKGKILKPDIDRYGYLTVRLSKNGKTQKFLIHRLVATSFIDNLYHMKIVNHIDANKKNNHHLNLEWCTAKENVKHALDNGLQRVQGSGNGNSKLLERQVLDIRFKHKNKEATAAELADFYQVEVSTIYKIINRELWSWLKEGDLYCV